MEQKLKLTANILYAGIGCQERGFENSGVIGLDVLAISEIDSNAVLSYAAIHKGLTPELVAGYGDYPTEEEMVRELTDMNIGYDTAGGTAIDWSGIQKDSFVGRQYAEFYQEHGYIPKNFNAKDCREITDYAPTLATGCGTAASIGSILFFDAVKEAAAVINNEELDLERSLFMIKKIIRIAEPQERRKVKELLDTYGFTMADTD